MIYCELNVIPKGGGVTMWMPLEINSFVWKAMKENQECTSGDYCNRHPWIWDTPSDLCRHWLMPDTNWSFYTTSENFCFFKTSFWKCLWSRSWLCHIGSITNFEMQEKIWHWVKAGFNTRKMSYLPSRSVHRDPHEGPLNILIKFLFLAIFFRFSLLLCLNDLLWSQNNTFKLYLREHKRLLTISFVSRVECFSYLWV